jgi:hypothetical protein
MVGQSQRKVDGGRIPGIAEITNCVEIIMRFTGSNSKTGSVRTFGSHEGSFVASQAMANQLFNALKAHWNTRLSTMLNAISFINLSVRDMTIATNPEWISDTPAQVIPASGTSMPNDVSLVLTAATRERGRGANGRMYFWGWSTLADAGLGQATQAAQDGLTGFGSDIMLELNAVALNACVGKPHRQEYIGLTGAHHDERPAHIAQVIAYACRDKEWDTQRRRGM